MSSIDHYRYLGLGAQRHASKAELERAYVSKVGRSIFLEENGTAPSPFSDGALEARDHILDLARQALITRSPARSRLRVSNGSGRIHSSFSFSFPLTFLVAGVALRPTHESVAIPLSWVTGVLLLALESGDYENCVGIGSALLEQSKGSGFGMATGSLKLKRSQKRDAALAVALSHCELAKVYLDNPSGQR